jgi:hypothetical protein
MRLDFFLFTLSAASDSLIVHAVARFLDAALEGKLRKFN